MCNLFFYMSTNRLLRRKYTYKESNCFFCACHVNCIVLYLFELCVVHKNKEIKNLHARLQQNSKRRNFRAHGKSNYWFKVDHQRRSINEPKNKIKIITLKTQKLDLNRSDRDSIDYKLDIKCTWEVINSKTA